MKYRKMPNFKLFGYSEIEANRLIASLREIFSQHPDKKKMVVTVIQGSVEKLVNPCDPCPYIEIADSNPRRGRSLFKELNLSLNEDIELTSIDIFAPAI